MMNSQSLKLESETRGFTFPALMYGVLIAGAGLAAYLLGVLLRLVGLFVDPRGHSLDLAQLLVWYSGMPVVAGLILIMIDLFVLLPRKRRRVNVPWDPPQNPELTVVLTAYNDESSIGLAVEDFLKHPGVKRVIVVDNNSKDQTSEVAQRAGGLVVHEPRQGYGHCFFRALQEGANCHDTDLTLLCEGDMTFRAYDIDKFLAFVPHADIVNGTRIVEQLRELNTQLTTFMFYGNFFVGKLLEAKHVGKGTFTDVGTTYKLCRNSALRRLLPLLNREINLEFNAYFLDRALAQGFSLVECPVTFHRRVGVSKGGNVNDFRALKVGLRMIFGIVISWRPLSWK
jgi:glycosyltransferase involved in cell wall biosynthesis